MSAEVLRRAAAVMRERAEAATPGPWEHRDSEWPWVALYVDEASIPEADSLPSVEPGGSAGHADMEHIASWHPAVALAVADWLEESAEHLEAGEENDDLLPHVCPTALEGLECSVLGQSLAVARAYLGEQS